MKNEWLENKKNEEFLELCSKPTKTHTSSDLNYFYANQFVQNEKPKWEVTKNGVYMAKLRPNIYPETVAFHYYDENLFDKKLNYKGIGFVDNNNKTIGFVVYREGYVGCTLDKEELENITISYEYKM